MSKAKLKKEEKPANAAKVEINGISNIAQEFEGYKDAHWRLTQQILSIEAKLKEKRDERRVLEKEMKETALEEKPLWDQIEFAF